MRDGASNFEEQLGKYIDMNLKTTHGGLTIRIRLIK